MKHTPPPARTRFSPALIGSLTVLWLMLSQSVSAGSIVLGLVLAVALTWASATLRPLRAHVRRPLALVRLSLDVLVDVVRSNFAVARIVLGLVRERQVSSRFLDIPLDLEDPHGLAVLASIVTSTPGTVWVGLTPDGKTLTLHVLDLRDEDAFIRWIKTRYEQPLKRIFE